MVPAVEIADASLRLGTRTLWSDLNLLVEPGEFIAVIGPNGSGKTSLLRVLLGLQALSAGRVRIADKPPGRANSTIGYIPQQLTVAENATLRGIDLVGLGLDGHSWGLGLRRRHWRHNRVSAAIAAVGAQNYASAPVGRLSGGEQQRLRVAQALVGEPKVLLCDEPLLSLDVEQQRAVSGLIDARRRTANTAVVFVTHEINPILSYVDRVLYLVNGEFRTGTPDQVMNSRVLSELYKAKVEVITIDGQIHVVGAQSALCEDEPHHPHDKAGDG